MVTSLHMHVKSTKVCIETKSTPATLPLKDQATKDNYKMDYGL